jgi:hypothetical protein
MRPGAHLRGLGELHRLSGTLFEALRAEFDPPRSIPLDLARVDGLVDSVIQENQLVATVLLCTQLLHRETLLPEESQPRHVVSLCDTIDQMLTTLLEESERESPGARALRDAHDRISRIGVSLAVLADPGAPDWTR